MSKKAKEPSKRMKIDTEELRAYMPIKELVKSPSFRKAMSLSEEQRKKIFEQFNSVDQDKEAPK